MLDWTKRFRSTPTLQLSAHTPSESGHLSRKLQAQNQQLTEQLFKSLDAFQALAKQQADTLDRIVQSKFDLPIVAQPREVEASVPMFPASQMGDLLSIEDDAEFLKAVTH